MQISEFTLEIQDGSNSYVHREFVIANDDRAAARFARALADHWRPNAVHDHEHDLYSDPAGWPQWMLGRCGPMGSLKIPVAGTETSVRMSIVPTVSLVRYMEFTERILRALDGSRLTARALRWILARRAKLGRDEFMRAAQALLELSEWHSAIPSVDANESPKEQV